MCLLLFPLFLTHASALHEGTFRNQSLVWLTQFHHIRPANAEQSKARSGQKVFKGLRSLAQSWSTLVLKSSKPQCRQISVISVIIIIFNHIQSTYLAPPSYQRRCPFYHRHSQRRHHHPSHPTTRLIRSCSSLQNPHKNTYTDKKHNESQRQQPQPLSVSIPSKRSTSLFIFFMSFIQNLSTHVQDISSLDII